MTEIKDRDVVRSLARGLAVIRAFEGGPARLTPSEVARRAGITRAAARRSLLTLVAEGYAWTDGKRFCLAPPTLALGRAYLSGFGICERALPAIERLTKATGLASALGLLEGGAVRIVARVPVAGGVETMFGLSETLPAYASALGRVLLANLPEAALQRYLNEVTPKALTRVTMLGRADLARAIGEARRQDWALVDQEMRIGLRGIAVPVRDGDGAAHAAIELACETGRMSLAAFRDEMLPRVRATSAQISDRLAARHAGSAWRAGETAPISRSGDPVSYSR